MTYDDLEFILSPPQVTHGKIKQAPITDRQEQSLRRFREQEAKLIRAELHRRIHHLDEHEVGPR